MHTDRHDTTVAWYRRPAVLGLFALGGFVAVYLAVQNWEQAGPYLPWLLILAMPLMHVFMHRGHGAHSGQGGQAGHGAMGCCGGHGTHSDKEDHTKGSDHSHGDSPARLGDATGAEARAEPVKQAGGCCGSEGHSHHEHANAPNTAETEGCCGGAAPQHSDRSQDSSQHGRERG